MERHDRPPVATFLADGPFAVGAAVELSEGATHHARVKRLETGDVVRLTDGSGRVAIGSISSVARSGVTVVVETADEVPSPPAIHLRVPMADRDRMILLAEKATELGIASWQAVRFRRSASVNPRGEGPAFAEKARARMISALEQSGGAWLPHMLPDVSLDELAKSGPALRILLDAGGGPLAEVSGSEPGAAPTILVGPEGGLEASELSLLVAAGWKRVCIAPNILRFETAGIAAVAALRANQTHHGE